MTSIAAARPTPTSDDVNAATAAGLIESAIDRLQRASTAAMRIDTVTGAHALDGVTDALAAAHAALTALRAHDSVPQFHIAADAA